MAKLIVKDPRNGEEREMTERSFQLAGQKRGFTIVKKIEAPKSDIQKLMDQKIAEKAAKESAQNTLEQPVLGVLSDEPKKRGPKPKNTEA